MNKLMTMLPIMFVLLIGSIVFFSLYPAFILNPYFTSWMSTGDPSQHYFGFNFFLHEKWQLPPGKIASYSWPFGTSLIYTDALPLVSIPLKLFFAKQTLQFHGLWILFCFLMQSFSGYWLIRLVTDDRFKAVLASAVWVTFPPFLFRSFENTRHYSLLSQFLVTFLIGLTYLKLYRKIDRPIAWMILLFSSLGIHFYLFALIGAIWCFLHCSIYNLNYTLKKLAPVFLATVLGMWFFGYFTTSPANSFELGFTIFSMNGLSFFNSDGFSWILPKLPTLNSLQREGFQYLGAGALLAGLLAIGFKKSRDQVKQVWTVLCETDFDFILLFILLFAVSIRISVGTLILPDTVTGALYILAFAAYFRRKKKFSLVKSIALALASLVIFMLMGRIFRSSGRYGWLLGYGFLAVLFQLKTSRSVLVLLVALQLIDTIPFIRAVALENQALMQNLQNQDRHDPDATKEIDSFMSGHQNTMLLGWNDADSIVKKAALRLGMNAGPTYTARGPRTEEFLTNNEALLRSGKGDPATVYVLADENLFKELKKLPQFSTFESGSLRLLKLNTQP
jgi:Family of unknown function (DUF6311)